MKKVMQVVDVIAFCILLIGGINYFLAALFGVDLMVMLFGTNISVIGRIVYGIIGASAVLLLGTIVARTIINNQKQLHK